MGKLLMMTVHAALVRRGGGSLHGAVGDVTVALGENESFFEGQK